MVKVPTAKVVNKAYLPPSGLYIGVESTYT